MSIETLRTEAEHHSAAINAAEERLNQAMDREEAAHREVADARAALEEARTAGSGTLAAWKVVNAEDTR